MRHIKIKAAANPHDPAWDEYFESRWGKRMLVSAKGRAKLYRVWLKQGGRCCACLKPVTKDSALALYKTLQNPAFEIDCLLTSVNQKFQRVSMHGLRVELLQSQAESIGLPLEIVEIPEMPTMEVYENALATTLTQLKTRGITH